VVVNFCFFGGVFKIARSFLAPKKKKKERQHAGRLFLIFEKPAGGRGAGACGSPVMIAGEAHRFFWRAGEEEACRQ